MKSKKNNLVIKGVLLIVVIAIGVLAAYSAIVKMKNKEASEDSYPSNAYEILADRDLDISYPATPYEVLKLYNKYLKYIYNNEVDDEKFAVLVDKVRKMWAEEWLALNDKEKHLKTFKSEVKKFMEDGSVISNYVVSDSSTAQEFTTPQGADGKTLMCSYLFTKKKKTSKVYMKFYFLNENEQWKILYYEIVDESGKNLDNNASSKK